MRYFFSCLWLCLLCAPVYGAEICVENADTHAFWFTADDGVGHRARAFVPPAGRLCLQTDAAAQSFVSVFEHEDAFEGCSRLVSLGQSETLLRYVDFDRCEWSGHHSIPKD